MQFGRGYYEKHFCEIILNLEHRFWRCRFKDFSSRALMALMLDRRESFMQFG